MVAIDHPAGPFGGRWRPVLLVARLITVVVGAVSAAAAFLVWPFSSTPDQPGDGDWKTLFVVYEGFTHVLLEASLWLTAGLAMVIGGILYRRRSNLTREQGDERNAGPTVLIAFGILWLSFCVLGFGLALGLGLRLLIVYGSGEAEITEGVVRVLHEQPAGGGTEGDILEINGVQVEVDRLLLSPAYGRTIVFGGVLREGVYARVYHWQGRIVRIDVPTTPPKGTTPPPPTTPPQVPPFLPMPESLDTGTPHR